jgi:hypothetical protein
MLRKKVLDKSTAVSALHYTPIQAALGSDASQQRFCDSLATEPALLPILPCHSQHTSCEEAICLVARIAHRDVVPNEVPVALGGVELCGKAAHVSKTLWRVTAMSHQREPSRNLSLHHRKAHVYH